jgi:hypothetical protein
MGFKGCLIGGLVALVGWLYEGLELVGWDMLLGDVQRQVLTLLHGTCDTPF